MRKLVSPLVVVMLIAIACGGDDEPIEPTTTSSGSAADVVSSTTSSVPSSPATSQVPTTSTQVLELEPEETTETTPAATTATTEVAQVQPIDAVATLRAVGPVRIGMTVNEASTAAGVTLRRDFGRQATGNCYYVTPGAALRGVSIMVVDEAIARIEIDSPSNIATRSGVRIGTSASNLREVYPDNIQRANNAVLDGEAMAFVPQDDFDADFRIYFEIEGGQVARYRLGTKPAIDYLSGCPDE